MKLPRDLTGPELVKALERFGYAEVRQTGSHIRLETLENGQHHITVPHHKPLRIGTLASILSDVAAHFGLPRDEFLHRLLEIVASGHDVPATVKLEP